MIDEEEELYGHVKGWSTHLIVATGKSDWVRDVAGMFNPVAIGDSGKSWDVLTRLQMKKAV